MPLLCHYAVGNLLTRLEATGHLHADLANADIAEHFLPRIIPPGSSTPHLQRHSIGHLSYWSASHS